ncbi:MAG TPA: TonB-dependent receptor, partial [Rhizomicrobium sp.]|nr:TonB-dependent receptor [Rhizomicrobium sp.]
TEDYNRFNTAPGIFNPLGNGLVDANGYFCDPQLGCSNRLVAQDLSEEHAWQLSQEFRLASNFTGPFNFSVGGNFMHYETEENYYVFVNTLTALAAKSGASYAIPWVPGVYDNAACLKIGAFGVGGNKGYQPNDPALGAGQPTSVCMYIDPNPIGSLNNKGHNYFLSQNPYLLNSYALFGEVYYNVRDDLKLIGGLRWTEDQKHFTNFPSELVAQGWGYASTGVVDQQWDQFTGRAAVNWTPKLDFTDQTLIYASYAHGYKAGGANPPGANLYSYYNISFGGGGGSGGVAAVPIHPLTFKPEFIDAFELGSKNTLLDGALTFNVSAFYYDYKNYQISEIVDRTSINLNFDAKVKGAEIEAAWEPVPGLRFNFAGGWEDTSLAKGSNSVDLMDRTAGHSDWLLMKPFVTQSSNCILPAYVIAAAMVAYGGYGQGNPVVSLCGFAYADHVDPLTGLPYDPEHPRLTLADIGQGNVYAGIEPGSAIPADYPGFDPASAPNNGAGFSKDVSGNELPNAPPFTVSFGAQYSVPLTSDWAGTLRADYYWQDYSWARVFNDNPYDRLRGYTNVNLTLILTNQDGWQVMLYDKNVFNTTAITGAFLNSDDSGLTTNVFLTDPKLIGIRVTKNW